MKLQPIVAFLLAFVSLDGRAAESAVAVGTAKRLFLLIGQSNMAGRGDVAPEDSQLIPGIWSLDRNDKWIPAVDPLHWDRPEVAGVGLGRSFARALLDTNPDIAIGLIPCAVGGTALESWSPERELFRNAVRRTRIAQRDGTLCGILWHQGESDSRRSETASTYGERWQAFIRHLRKELGAETIPVVVGELGWFVRDRMLAGSRYGPYLDQVNRQIRSLASAENRIGVAASAGLGHRGDELHFSSPALREFGRRYAREFLRLFPEWRSMSPAR